MKDLINIAIGFLIGSSIIFVSSLFFYEPSIGAPVANRLRNVLPTANQTYDLGTTTPALEWNGIYTQDLFVSGTCTGCGVGGESIFTLTDTTTVEATTTNVGIGLKLDFFIATSTSATSTFAGGLSVGTVLFVDPDGGRVGIGTSSPTGTLHVVTTNVGGAIANSNADDFVVENSADSGISILSPDASFSRISFGSPADNVGAFISWKNSTSLLNMGSSKVGASFVLFGDNAIANLTLSGTSGNEVATFAGILTVTDGITAGSYGAASIDGDDINSNLAGRSLTLTAGSPDTLDIDSEIFTHSFTANIASSTMSTTTSVGRWKAPTAITLTEIGCDTTAGTSTIKMDIRAAGTPNSSGTAVLFAGGLACGSEFDIASTTFANTAMTAGQKLNFEISDADPVGTPATVLNIYVKYTIDD